MKRVLRVLTAAALGAALITISPLTTPASAATGDLACTANFQFNFTPALTLTNHQATATGTAGLINCTSLNGHFSALASGTVTATGNATAQSGLPCSLLLTISGKATIAWAPAGQSKLSYTVNTNPLAGTLTVSAHVDSGQLNGDNAIAVPVQANPNPDCAINGLTSLSSAAAVVTFA